MRRVPIGNPTSNHVSSNPFLMNNEIIFKSNAVVGKYQR
jgi:hypothetical protein